MGAKENGAIESGVLGQIALLAGTVNGGNVVFEAGITCPANRTPKTAAVYRRK